MTDERRMDRQPGLFLAAEAVCIYDKTDGFCTPRQRDVCKCWDIAKATMAATGMSAQAVAWLWPKRRRIEEEAAKKFGRSKSTTPIDTDISPTESAEPG